ncbi:MAG: hypothetical protein WBV28_23130, partial [Terracidiphilus sp.]
MTNSLLQAALSFSKLRGTICVALALIQLLILGALVQLSAYASSAPTTTMLSVTSAGNAVTTVAPGSLVTLTATVGVYPGLVKFCDASATYCTDNHLLGSAQLTSLGTASHKFIPGTGNHSYKAVFVGTSANASSSSQAQSLAVTGGSSTISTTISSAGVPGNYTLTATVTGAFPLPTGNVSFLDTTNGDSSLGNAPLTGTAPPSFMTASSPSVGPTPYAIAAGDFNG